MCYGLCHVTYGVISLKVMIDIRVFTRIMVNLGSMEICACGNISAIQILRTLLHVSRQFQSEMSSEWC